MVARAMMAQPGGGPTVYVETTVVSYYVGRPGRDLVVAARQELTRTWWRERLSHFQAFVSALVLQEARDGDAEAAAARLAAVAGMPLLDIDQDAGALAHSMVAAHLVPRTSAEDALHIAIAARHGMQYLVTWNCSDIANATLRRRLDTFISFAGYACPVICTPDELAG